MSPRKKQTAYGHGRIRRTAYGTFAADLARGLGGARLRRSFRTRAEAEAWIDAQSLSEAPPLTAAQLRDAAEAFALLPPGTSLAAFVRARVAGCAKTSAQELEALVEVYLDECRERLRDITVARYRRMLPAALASPLLGYDLARHTTAALREYLGTIPLPCNKTHALATLSAFYSWLIGRDLLETNPATRIHLPTAPRKPPAVLSLEDAQRLLDTAATFEGGCCLAYVAVCLFAGLRPTEARRLRASDIKREYIALTAEQTKMAAARTVPIRPNLRAILDRCHFSRESILPCAASSFHIVLTRLIKATGLAWPKDVMRHSFASYAYDLTKSAEATAFEMGHRGTSILFAHYRGLVAPGSGAKFFALLPRSFGNVLANINISV